MTRINRRDFGLLAALALIGIGIAIALGRWLPDGFHGGLFAAPVLLIGGGIAILVLRRPPDPEAGPPDAVPTRSRHIAPPTGDRPTNEAPTAAASAPRSAPEDAADPGAEPTLPLTPSAWTQTAPWPTTRDVAPRGTRRAAARRGRARSSDHSPSASC